MRNVDVVIRFANIKDLDAIVNIYNQAIRSTCATGDTKEFCPEERKEWFAKFDENDYPLYVAELQGNVVGYCSISPYRPGREAMSRVAEISYYLDYSQHGKGIGSALMDYAISDCPRIEKDSLLAILLDINKQSIGLLKKFGFEQWGYFPNIINLNGKRCGHLVYGLSLKYATQKL